MGQTMETSSMKTGSKWRLIRQADAEAGKPTFPELFFDLVFVFAMIQLSHTLAKDFGSTAFWKRPSSFWLCGGYGCRSPG